MNDKLKIEELSTLIAIGIQKKIDEGKSIEEAMKMVKDSVNKAANLAVENNVNTEQAEAYLYDAVRKA